MKTFLRFLIGSALCVLLTSCVVTSDNPLSPAETAHADLALLGDWYSKKDQDTYHYTLSSASWMHVVITHKQTDTGNKPGMIDLKPDEYDFYPTTIGNATYLNVVLNGKDDQGHPTKSYVFVRYTITTDHVLVRWMMSRDVLAATVRAGKLKGKVHQDKNPTMVGNPPQPDIDVNLTDTGENITKFILNSDVYKLFSDQMEPLERVKSAGK